MQKRASVFGVEGKEEERRTGYVNDGEWCYACKKNGRVIVEGGRK